MKSGQILILVLLIVVVSLAVGLSVASRNLTNLRISTQTEESQRAFSAAEGGVEDTLSRLIAIKTDIASGTSGVGANSQCNINATDLEASCNVPVGADISADIKVKARKVYTTPVVKLGDVAQVDLRIYNGSVKIDWPANPHVSLEVTLICDSIGIVNTCNGGVDHGDYAQNRYFFRGPNPPSADMTVTSPFTWDDCVPSGGICSKTISTPSSIRPQYLRIKPFYNNVVDLVVSGVSPDDLPTQIYEINSVAKTNLGITRRVQVTRTALPALPAVFDYVLYSEGDIVK